VLRSAEEDASRRGLLAAAPTDAKGLKRHSVSVAVVGTFLWLARRTGLMHRSRVEIRGNLGKSGRRACIYPNVPSVCVLTAFRVCTTPTAILGSVLTESKCHVFAADKGEREPLLAGALLQLSLVAHMYQFSGQTAT
jgi:hypothetical protein